MSGRVVIIGGGISGLSAAYYLGQGGVPSTLIESRARLGGVIQTDRLGGCIIEAGPDSFLTTKPAALDLIRSLGMTDQVIGSNDHLRVTFVKKNGRLVPLPDGLMMMVPTKVLPMATTPLLSIGTKVRMAMELLRAPKPSAEDQSVAEFVRAHYGQETVDYLAEPLLSGIYGGDPAQLSVRAVLPRFVALAAKYGSLTRGVLASRAPSAAGSKQPIFSTLRDGLGSLVDALQTAIAPHTEVRQSRAETIERTAEGYRVRVAGEWIAAGQVIVACEAHHAAGLTGTLDGRLSELLASVGYSSSVIAALVYDAADLKELPRGFGFLIPKKERRRLVACTWVGTKFAHRAPADKVIARCFLGGAEDPAVLNESDEAIVATIADELRVIAGITAVPKHTRVSRWPRAMAQFTIGHLSRMAELDARVATLPGVYLAGNAYQGIGIPDCIRLGKSAAERATRELQASYPR